MTRRRILLQATALAPLAAQADRRPVQVASFPDFDRSTRAVMAQAERDGRPIQLVSRAYADHHQAMNAVLATGHGQPDVMALDLRFIGKFAAGGGFEDLSAAPYADATLLARLPAFSVAQARTPRGALMAMPADIGPGTLLYRQDLLQRAGLQEADLTQDWSAYLKAGQRLRQATGTALLTDAGELRDILLRSGLQPGEGLYFDNAGRVLVNSERFHRAFEAGLSARRLGLDLKATSWSNEWVAAYRRGLVATQMMGCWLAGHLKNWLAPDQVGLWRSAPLPGGLPASYGGSFYAIPRGAQDKAGAWQFIRQMVFEPATQLQSLRVVDAFPALLATHQDAVMDEALPYLGGQRARRLWRDIAARVPPVPVSKFDALATAIVRDAFEQVVGQGKRIPEALRDAQSLIQRRARR